jgi:hypothetical protein
MDLMLRLKAETCSPLGEALELRKMAAQSPSPEALEQRMREA